MVSERIFIFIGMLATLSTVGYFLENRVPDAKRALFALTASYLWAVWAFQSSEVFVANVSESPMELRALLITGYAFSFIMVALGLYRAAKVIFSDASGNGDQ